MFLGFSGKSLLNRKRPSGFKCTVAIARKENMSQRVNPMVQRPPSLADPSDSILCRLDASDLLLGSWCCGFDMLVALAL